MNFNLVTTPWVKVSLKDGTSCEVSLEEFFSKIDEIQTLHGETSAQDLSTMRFILSIMSTVYTRVNADGESYDWLNDLNDSFFDADSAKDDLLNTWKELYESHDFGQVISYLSEHESQFDFFGEQSVFTVPRPVFNSFVEAKKQITEKSLEKRTGTVSVSLINRQINESGNSRITYKTISDINKNKIRSAELVRWLIAYQSFTGSTDKTKIKFKEKFSASSGYLYGLNSVFVQGKDMADTLMLNQVLFNDSDELNPPRPIWEQSADQIVSDRLEQKVPDNLAELYTVPSRLLHVDWDDDEPVIFSAALPKFPTENLFLEPMTTWRWDKKLNAFKPNPHVLTNASVRMWQHFGEYVNVSNERRIPTCVWWINTLRNEDLLSNEFRLNLHLTELVKDGNASSQLPALELNDDLSLDSALALADDSMTIRVRVQDAITHTQQVGKFVWGYGKSVDAMRHAQASTLGSKLSEKFYQELNVPFENWLSQLNPDDDITEKIKIWNEQCYNIAKAIIDSNVKKATNSDFAIDENGFNIFSYRGMTLGKIKKELSLNAK